MKKIRYNALDRAVNEMSEYPFLTYVRDERLIFWNEDRNYVLHIQPFSSKEECKKQIRDFLKRIDDVKVRRLQDRKQLDTFYLSNEVIMDFYKEWLSTLKK